ncbi:unannotated protein [freshwater metagenome]|jgi:hypothetical protein|uniref:Unannotated protein n=1 Tax=freshwater metagenome TaxID=449393 RepID=A0A6J7GTW6_9ZZZZ
MKAEPRNATFDAAFDAVTGAGYHRDATGQLAS